MKSQNLQKENEIKKLILILALGFALAACAAETPVPTATPVPPTVTSVPPTVTPIPPTITPEPWDAEVYDLAVGLHQLPHLNSHIMETFLGGTMVDLLAITEDQEWVQATAYLEGGSTITGWLQVNKLRLNVSLDDLPVDTETVFALPPTRTPGPTRTPKPTDIPLGERYMAHFIDSGFELYNDQGVYAKKNGRMILMAANLELGQLIGYVVPSIMTPEELDVLREHVIEASEFLDPGFGWETVKLAINSMDDFPTGTVWLRGREVNYAIMDDGDTVIATYIFMNVATFIGPDNTD